METATEIKSAFMKTLAHELANGNDIDLRKVFPVATQEITALVKQKLKIVSNQTGCLE